jgi:hypothetical protein
MTVSGMMGILADTEVNSILYEEKLFSDIFTIHKFKEIAKIKFKSRNLTNN